MQMSHIKYCSMDDEDIHHYLPNAKLLTYNDLANVENIEELYTRIHAHIHHPSSSGL